MTLVTDEPDMAVPEKPTASGVGHRMFCGACRTWQYMDFVVEGTSLWKTCQRCGSRKEFLFIANAWIMRSMHDVLGSFMDARVQETLAKLRARRNEDETADDDLKDFDEDLDELDQTTTTTAKRGRFEHRGMVQITAAHIEKLRVIASDADLLRRFNAALTQGPAHEDRRGDR